MKASELDKKFDDNQEDILEYFDTSAIKMINEAPKRSKNPTLKGQVLLTPIRGYHAFHLKGVRVTVSPILI